MFFVQTIRDFGQKIQVNKISKALFCTVHKFNKIPTTNGQYIAHVHASSNSRSLFTLSQLHFRFISIFPNEVTQTTLNADCMVDVNRDAMVWEANCWIFCLASERNMCFHWVSNFKNDMNNHMIDEYLHKWCKGGCICDLCTKGMSNEYI